MQCPKCQFDNREGAKFCLECGAKFEQPCPECGKSLPLSAKFCDECGHDLKKPQDTDPIDYSKPNSYTPKHLADKILTTRTSLEGERKIVTVLFADVANYTSMSEKLDPEEVHQIMDGAFNILMDEIHKFEGTINQFTGDGIMALFGAPIAHENHAQRACHAALAIQKAIKEYGEKIQNTTGVDFKMRIGINSGPVIVGAIGDDLRMDYTAVGDTTNLAARMESAAKPGTIMVSADTHRAIERYFDFKDIGALEIKGKEFPQKAYELLKASDVVTRLDASVAKGLTRFVGRQSSMTSLMEIYNKVTSGAGQVVGVVGEAGVGKSRLILEMKNRLPENEYTYLEGQCLQYGSSILYVPVLDILKSLFDIKDDDREYIIKKKIKDKISQYKDLEGALPAFQDLLSVKVDDEHFLKLEPKNKREKIFESIRDLFISVSQEKPLIVVIEDLHWIDEASEAFFNYLIEWIANTSIMLVLLYRTEYRHQWGSKTYYHKIGLDQLGADSSAELVKSMLEEGDVAPELKELILNRAAGNPLFMEELTHTLIENGTIKKAESRYVLSRNISDIQIPDTVQGIIAARMDRLEENLKRTMQVASVIGRDFAFRILQTITGMREELKSYLLNLQGLEFIYEKRLFPELEYIFKHALTREVAYNSLLVKRRKDIHENIGKAIEEIYRDRLEEFYEILSYHYLMSDSYQKASEYLKLSGNKAFSKYANQEAYHYYKEALNTLKKLPETVDRKKEEIEIGLLMLNPIPPIGFPEEAKGIIINSQKLAKELGDKESELFFFIYILGYYLIKGNPKKVIKYGEPFLLEAQNNNDFERIIALSRALDFANFAIGNFLKVLDTAPGIIKMLEKNNKQHEYFGLPFNVYSSMCSYCGSSYAYIGRFEDSKKYLDKGLNFSVNLNNVLDIALSESFYMQNYLCKFEIQKAVEKFQKVKNYHESADLPYMQGQSHGWASFGYYYLGDFEAAKANIKKGRQLMEKANISWRLSLFPLASSYIHYDLNEISIAKENVEEAIELSICHDERQLEALAWISLGRIIAKKDLVNFAEAEANILKGIKILDDLQLRPYLTQSYFHLGEFYANTGRKEKALEPLNKSLSMCQEMGIGYWPDKIKEVLDRL